MKYLCLSFLFFLFACKTKLPYGQYKSTPQPFVSHPVFLTIFKNGQFSYSDSNTRFNVKGNTVIGKDTLFFYSDSFKHTIKSTTKDMSYYYSIAKDTSEALLLRMFDSLPYQPNQLTINDSMDVFFIRDGKLYPINPKGYNIKGFDESYYFKKIGNIR
jgi:hypothetical protein